MNGPRYDTGEAPRGSTAAERAAYALQQIEGAQNLLAAAAANLFPIIGWAPEWRRIGKLYDQIKGCWYRLDAKRLRSTTMKLDGRRESSP